MTALNVLQLSTFPIVRRVHGGQRRCGALYDGLRRNGANVLFVSVGQYTIHKPPEGHVTIGIKGKTLERVCANATLEDILIGETAFQEPETKYQFFRCVRRFKPDVIVFEQPYLWPGLKQLLDQLQLTDIPIVHSSYNIEYLMKEETHTRGLPSPERERIVSMVRGWEEDLCRQSTLTVAVSESDADALRRMGAKNCVVVRNGSDPKVVDPAKIKEWQDRLFGAALKRFALYVSSAHLPNILDLERTVGRFFGYLPPDAGIVVAGSAARQIKELNLCGVRGQLSQSRLKLFDRVEDSDIAALFSLASAIILPMGRGGGSNIKTAEALLSGRPIVATSFAFRSFEEFTKFERVRICDRPEDFQATLQRVLMEPEAIPVHAQPQEDHLQSITWKNLGDQFAREVLKKISASGRLDKAA